MDLPLLAGLLSSALFLLLSLSSLAFFCRHRTPVVDLESGIPTELEADGDGGGTKAALRRFGWDEVESLTSHFAPSAVIGLGGFSTVYAARLPNTLAAIKVHRSSERLHRAFRQELSILLRLRHPHIVRLLGYSDDRSDDGALVFEFVPGGTLHDLLHGGGGTPPVLPWARRAGIARRVAAAVEYLHEGCDPSVVHGDVKTANVLLDAQLEPKLCDFGSAAMGFSAAVAAAEKNPMMGSPGYVDPHYLRTGLVSKKSDVYSFGVLLLELLTGDEAFCPDTDRPLTAAVGPLLRDGRAREVAVDPTLEGGYDAEEAAAVAELAARCVGEQPTLRPTMTEVLQILREKVTSADGSGKDSDGSVR